MIGDDRSFMQKAHELAAGGRGFTSPNPLVGAVVVNNGRIKGKGFHEHYGGPHAEVNALKDAGAEAMNGTLYVNLEPCCHHGKTPPCTDAVQRAGIKRVVCSMKDPNEMVSGKGAEILRDAGIRVEIGLMEKEARRLNERYIKFITTGRPFVLLKMGVSLDGRIADENRKSQWIGCPEALDYSHELRDLYDCIMVGIGTVIEDDPALNVRLKDKSISKISRAVLDGSLKISREAKMFSAENGGDIYIFTSEDAPEEKRIILENAGANVIPLACTGSGVDMDKAVEYLGGMGHTGLIIEGGSHVAFSALGSRLVDKIVFVIAPKIIGGLDSVPAVGGTGFGDLVRCPLLVDTRTFSLGVDMAYEGYVNYRH